jgi:hypothetical protein
MPIRTVSLPMAWAARAIRTWLAAIAPPATSNDEFRKKVRREVAGDVVAFEDADWVGSDIGRVSEELGLKGVMHTKKTGFHCRSLFKPLTLPRRSTHCNQGTSANAPNPGDILALLQRPKD